jgi:hypothetical protein
VVATCYWKHRCTTGVLGVNIWREPLLAGAAKQIVGPEPREAISHQTIRRSCSVAPPVNSTVMLLHLKNVMRLFLVVVALSVTSVALGKTKRLASETPSSVRMFWLFQRAIVRRGLLWNAL